MKIYQIAVYMLIASIVVNGCLYSNSTTPDLKIKFQQTYENDVMDFVDVQQLVRREGFPGDEEGALQAVLLQHGQHKCIVVDVAADGEGQGSEDTENNPCERYHEVGIAAA